MKPITERKQAFKQAIWEAIGKNFDKYSKELVADFYDWWTRHNEPVRENTLMLWEKTKRDNKGIFQITGRLATFKKKQDKWNEGKPALNGFKANPDNWYWKAFDGQRFQLFKAFMRENNYIYNGQFNRFDKQR